MKVWKLCIDYNAVLLISTHTNTCLVCLLKMQCVHIHAFCFVRVWHIIFRSCIIVFRCNLFFSKAISNDCFSAIYCQNDNQVLPRKVASLSQCQTMLECNRSVYPLQGKLADNAFFEHPTCWKLLNVNLISSFIILF